MANVIRYFFAVLGVGFLGLTTAIVFGLYSLPVGKVAPVDFPSLALAPQPNQYLVCPEGFCPAAPHRISPLYNMTAGDLQAQWSEWLAGQSGLVLTSQHSDSSQATYVERSRLMGYPDLITVRFIPVGDQQSTIAIYSRSVYGYSDLGVNKARIDRWLEQFQS